MSGLHRFVILLFAGLVVWLAWQSRISSQSPILQSGEQQHQQSTSAHTDTKNQSDKLDWNNWTHDPIAVFTGLLTVFNGLLFASPLAFGGLPERPLISLIALSLNWNDRSFSFTKSSPTSLVSSI